MHVHVAAQIGFSIFPMTSYPFHSSNNFVNAHLTALALCYNQVFFEESEPDLS